MHVPDKRMYTLFASKTEGADESSEERKFTLGRESTEKERQDIERDTFYHL